MAMLSGAHPGCRIVDPCCGTGTLLVEARRLMPDGIAIGLDIDRNSLRAASSNGTHADCRWMQADLGALPFRDGFADCVLANLPWGRQVEARGLIEGDMSLAIDEILRILAPRGNAVLLAAPGETMAGDRHVSLWSIPIRLAGRRACIQIVSAQRDNQRGPVCFQGQYGRSLQRMWTRYGAATC